MGTDVASEPRRRSGLFTPPAMRRSMSAAAAASSTGKRSPSARRSSHGAAPDVEPFDIPQHDEEAERRQERQQQAAADRRRSLPGIDGLSHGQLAAHYASCVKLSAENKINAKNAFSLQLIDCMAQMMRQKKSDLDNFQVASYTLDASAKIYGCRVEALHGETLRMAGGLGRAEAKPREEGDEPADGEDAAPGEKRRRKVRRNTVHKNLASITLRGNDQWRPGGADPAAGGSLLRRSPWTAAEDGTGCTCLLGLLPARDDGRFELLVNNDGRPSGGDAADAEPADQQPPTVTVPAVEERVLGAPSLERFSFTTWSLEQERDSERMEMPPPPPPAPIDPRHRFDMNAPPHSPIAEEDSVFGGVDDDYDGDPAGGGDTLVTVGGAGCRPAEAPTLVSMVSAVPQEYSYFDQPRLLAWAGPRHWKHRLAAGAARQQTAPAEPARRRRRKDAEPHDYDAEVVWQAAFAEPKRTTKLKQATMKKWSDEKTTLPEDLHYDVASLFKLFLRPDMRIVRDVAAAAADSQSQVDMDGSVADYDYDNDRDTNDYCPGLPLGEGCDDYDQEATFLPSGGACDASELLSTTQAASDTPGAMLFGDNLVQAPKKVEKILIPYARTAKKMDMRKLKAAMWGILSEKANDDKENAVTPGPLSLKEALQMPDGRDFSFRELYHRLPSRMSTKMADNLSVALAFTALLHTANERCLRIEGTRRLEDFFVAQDSL